jgi:hypothetical protein
MEIHVYRKRINRDGYTSSGEYFGTGSPLFCYVSDCGNISGAVRSHNKWAAKRSVKNIVRYSVHYDSSPIKFVS